MRAAALARSWARALAHPTAAMCRLPTGGWPKAALAAVVFRFAVQDVVETLPLALLGRRPFRRARLPVRPDRHYRAQLVFLPPLGVGEWLVMGGVAHGVLRMWSVPSEPARVLDVIGVGMLLPMPVLWLCDVTVIATNRLRLPELASVNPPLQLWEAALFAVGLRAVLGAPAAPALAAAVAASVVYVVPSSQFFR